ncbi:MAG TPA: hypothetical protein VK038_02505 [Ornithinicoccus sp.]|jgi:hypothetical protein|nr:hypothetical protein [Ornithinicoccus sp.]
MNTTTRRTGVALAAVALLLAGCGSEVSPEDPTTGVDGPGQTPEEPTDDTPTGTTDPQDTDTRTATDAPGDSGPIELGVDNVGDLTLPVDAEEALAALVPLIGEPTTDEEGQGCEPDSTSRILWWDDFGMFGQGEGDTVRLSAWEVVGTDRPESIVLPHGLEIGDPEEAVREALPDAEWAGPEGTPHGGKLALDGALMVKLDAQDNTVSSVSAHASEVSCE